MTPTSIFASSIAGSLLALLHHELDVIGHIVEMVMEAGHRVSGRAVHVSSTYLFQKRDGGSKDARADSYISSIPLFVCTI